MQRKPRRTSDRTMAGVDQAEVARTRVTARGMGLTGQHGGDRLRVERPPALVDDAAGSELGRYGAQAQPPALRLLARQGLRQPDYVRTHLGVALATWHTSTAVGVSSTKCRRADAAASGADPVGDRPGFAEMLEALLANGARTIIVESPDRFARDLMVQLAGHNMLKTRWKGRVGEVSNAPSSS